MNGREKHLEHHALIIDPLRNLTVQVFDCLYLFQFLRLGHGVLSSFLLCVSVKIDPLRALNLPVSRLPNP